MNNKITGNEPAVPVYTASGNPFGPVDSEYLKTVYTGLTIRQHFAAMAMKGILSNSPDWNGTQSHNEWVAKISVSYADALIAELNKTK